MKFVDLFINIHITCFIIIIIIFYCEYFTTNWNAAFFLKKSWDVQFTSYRKEARYSF